MRVEDEYQSSYYSVGAVALLLGVSDETVHRWIRSGDIKAYRFGERCTRIHAEDVAAFVKAAGTQNPAEPSRPSTSP